LTLTLSSPYYRSDLSHLTGISIGSPVYAQVDSANTSTTYGGVLETHEINGLPYSNISAPVSATVSLLEVLTLPATSSEGLFDTLYLLALTALPPR